MKLTKIFGIVLSLHVGVILIVMLQPSCQTVEKKPPDQEIEKSTTAEDSGSQDDFNAGLTESEPSREKLAAPTRPPVGELIVPGQTGTLTVPMQETTKEKNSEVDSISLVPSDVSIYKVERGDTLWGIARKKGISLASLLAANPTLDKNGRLSIGQELMVPENTGPPAVVSSTGATSPVGEAVNTSSYVVQKGDNLSRIARNEGVSLKSLMEINGMSSSSILRIGQTLKIPEGGSVQSPLMNLDSQVVPEGASTHTVKKGENLTRISAIYGTTIREIMEWNGLNDSSRISVGQVLVVSGSQPGTPSDNESFESLLSPENTEEDDASSVQDFFKELNTDRPIIDVPENNP